MIGKVSIGTGLLVVSLAGACSSSKPQTGAATPVELVSEPNCGNLRLTLVNGTIYYTNNTAGTVSSVAVTGGTPKVIAMAQNKPNPVASDGTSVFWGNDGDKTVMKQAVAGGGAATTFLPASTDPDPTNGPNVANALLVDGTTIYVGRGVDTYKLPTAGGTPVHLSRSPDEDLGHPGAFALDATHLYQTELLHLAISRESIDGMQMGLLGSSAMPQALAPDRIAVSQSALVTDAVAVSGQNVVWGNGPSIAYHDKDKNEHESTLAKMLNGNGFNPLTGFIISGSKVYLGESGDDTVEVGPLSFTVDQSNVPTATVIADHQPNPSQFAADATNIYWAAIETHGTGACKIMKLAK
jgi:hypothetical protein